MENVKFADLHLHSNRSDGLHSPSLVIEKAADKGFSCVSITDHDTVSGLNEASGAAERAGIEFIPGVEISSYEGSGSVHILGYFIDPGSEAIKKMSEGSKERRGGRMERVVAKLNKLGYPVDLQEVLDSAGDGTIGRAILARHLVEKGHFPTVDAVFASILGDGKAAYEPVQGFSPEEAIELIAEAGGVSSLAHPGCCGAENNIDRYVEAGLDGIEAYTPHHTPGAQKRYLEIADKHDLLITGGSDFHGEKVSGSHIGSVKLPYSLVERVKERAAALVNTER